MLITASRTALEEAFDDIEKIVGSYIHELLTCAIADLGIVNRSTLYSRRISSVAASCYRLTRGDNLSTTKLREREKN